MRHPFDGIDTPQTSRRSWLAFMAGLFGFASVANAAAPPGTKVKLIDNNVSPEPTTEKVGEEGGPSTRARGEEGGATTKAIGEEGAITKAKGEDGGPKMTTLAVGEEGGPKVTTRAIGEEGAVTKALREAGGGVPMTDAIGEAGKAPPVVTLAIGEGGK